MDENNLKLQVVNGLTHALSTMTHEYTGMDITSERADAINEARSLIYQAMEIYLAS